MSSISEHSPFAQTLASWGNFWLIGGVLCLLTVMLAPFGYFGLLMAWIYGYRVKSYAYGRHGDDPCWAKGRSLQRWALGIALVPVVMVLLVGLKQSF